MYEMQVLYILDIYKVNEIWFIQFSVFKLVFIDFGGILWKQNTNQLMKRSLLNFRQITLICFMQCHGHTEL